LTRTIIIGMECWTVGNRLGSRKAQSQLVYRDSLEVGLVHHRDYIETKTTTEWVRKHWYGIENKVHE